MIVPNIIFVVGIGFATAYLTFLTAKGNLTDNRQRKYWSKLTKRGKIVFFVLFAMLSLLILQEINSQNLSNLNNRKIAAEELSRDSIITEGIKQGVDSTSNKLYNDISKSFLNQGIKFDSLRKNFQKLKDSVKSTTVNNFPQDVPVLRIGSYGIIFDSIKKYKNSIGGYMAKFTSVNAASTNFKIAGYLLTENADPLEYDLSKFNFFPNGLTIPKNLNWSTGWGQSKKARPISKIYLYLQGKYTTADGTITQSIDELYYYDPLSKKTSTLLNEERNRILSIIKSIPDSQLKTRNE